MFYYLVFFFIVVYTFLIASKFLRLRNTNSLLARFGSSLDLLQEDVKLSRNAFQSNSLDEKLKETGNIKHLEELISLMPEVKDILDTWQLRGTLGYLQSANTNYKIAVEIYYKLLESTNQQSYDCKKVLNPKFAVLYILSIPSKIISLFGLNFKKEKSKNIFDAASWLLALFNNELKSAILEIWNTIVSK